VVVEPSWRNENSDDAAQISRADLGDFTAIRYLNVHESPGSISLAVRPSAIASVKSIALPVGELGGVASSPLLAKIGVLRVESDRREALRMSEPSPLDLIRRQVAAERKQLPGWSATRVQPSLPVEIDELLEAEYLAGVSQPVRERFTSALHAWRDAQREPVSDSDYVTRFASIAATLTQHEQVIQLFASRPTRSVVTQ
jgi:hypothetical protein